MPRAEKEKGCIGPYLDSSTRNSWLLLLPPVYLIRLTVSFVSLRSFQPHRPLLSIIDA